MGVGVLALAQAVWIAVTGTPFLGEIKADRGVAAAATAVLGIGWLALMRGSEKKPGQVFLGRTRLTIPGRPVEKIRYSAISAIDADGSDGLRIAYRYRFVRTFPRFPSVRTLRIADRDAFVVALFGRIELDQERSFAANLRSS